jgi:hypothetical protein
MNWIEAIEEVLKVYGGPMNYEVITKEIIKKGYKLATRDPKFTVNSQLTKKGNRNKVMSLGNGKYMLVDKCVKSCASYSPSDSNYKKASDFIKSSELSKLDNEELVLLELIVNFRLPLEKGEVCFADILDKLEVEISEEEKCYSQLIDKALLKKKLDELGLYKFSYNQIKKYHYLQTYSSTSEKQKQIDEIESTMANNGLSLKLIPVVEKKSFNNMRSNLSNLQQN